MDKETAWYVIGSTVYGALPAPEMVRIQDHSIHIEAFTCADVDAWAEWLKLPQPWLVTGTVYGTVEFYDDGGGWLGASIITVQCEKPTEIAAMKEEMRSGNERESVAA